MTSRKDNPGKGKNKKTILKDPQPMVRGDVTVRDCMTWHYQRGYKPTPEQTEAMGREHYLPHKPDLGRAKSRGYEMENDGMHGQIQINDDGTACQALRGWPGYRQEDVVAAYEDQLPPIDMRKSGADNDKKDPWMADLISYRFLNDAMRKKMEEEAEEARRQAEARRSRKGGSGAEFKGNRTSQLRAIALAGKVDIDPRDLWQLPKFKNNAKPHLTTVKAKQQKQRKVPSAKADSVRGGSGCGSYGVNYESNGNHDIDTYNLNGEMDYFNHGKTSPGDAYDYKYEPTHYEVDPIFKHENDEALFAV